MAELEELEQEELNKGMRDVRLPSVPSTSLPSRPGKLLACHFTFLMIKACLSRRRGRGSSRYVFNCVLTFKVL